MNDYEIVNKELNIKSCGIADLTMKQVSCFLSQWEDGGKIKELTMFNMPDGSVVLNRDNPNYEYYLHIAERYLISDDAFRKTLEEKAPKSLTETFVVLKNAAIYRTIWMALKNVFDNKKYRATLEIIAKRYCRQEYTIAFLAFRYGMIAGKREERARKRKKAAEKGIEAPMCIQLSEKSLV